MIRAYVLIEISAGHSRSLVSALEGREGIQEVVRVTGPYDVIAIINAENLNIVSDIVDREIHTLIGVVRTTTCVSMG